MHNKTTLLRHQTKTYNMNKKKAIINFMLVLGMMMVAITATAEDNRTLAFPGAEGFGRYATGGRGGSIKRVTNLNDSGTGSLREALKNSKSKIVIFEVSGTIHLQSELKIPANTTIAGQSAPGDGICIADYPCSINGDNIIVRYMRFRLGNKNITKNGADGWDGFGALDHNNIIIDHCSVSWSADECLSMSGCRDITVQWCLVSQSMNYSGHSKGNHGYGGNWGGAKSSYHHNLLVHHSSRVPRLGPRPTTQLEEYMDMRNNVMYNNGGNGCYGGEAMKVNIVNNYYKPGPATKSNAYQYRIAGLGIRTTQYITENPSYADAWHIWGKYYVKGNYNTTLPSLINDDVQWEKGIYEQIDASANDGLYNQAVKDSIRLCEPLAFAAVTTHSAEAAYEKVLQYAGACLHRDSYDTQMINDAKNGTATVYADEFDNSGNKTGKKLAAGLINSQEDLKPQGASSDWSAWPTLNSTAAPTDTDGDGMPDAWETANNLNPNDASDGKQLAENSTYTNVEIYLNSLVDEITTAQNQGGVLLGETLPNESYAVSYTLSSETFESADGNNTLFNNGFSISGAPISSGSYNFNTILIQKGKQYTISIPEDITINSLTFTGYCNGTSSQSSKLSEVNGKDVSSLAYNFPTRSSGNTKTYTINLTTAAKEKVTFTTAASSGNNTCMLITLDGIKEGSNNSPTGITSPSSYNNMNNGFIYNLQGQKVATPQQGGIYIINHKKVIMK